MTRALTLTAPTLTALAALALGAVTSARADPNLPPGRTGGDGSNQAAGPSGQHPGPAGEIGGAGPHPAPLSRPAQTPEDGRHAPASKR